VTIATVNGGRKSAPRSDRPLGPADITRASGQTDPLEVASSTFLCRLMPPKWREAPVLSTCRYDVPGYDVVTVRAVSVVEWAWQRQSVWDQTARRLRAAPRLARRLGLVLTVVAAALALAAAQLKPVSQPAAIGLAIAAAVVLAGVGLLRNRQSIEQVRKWTRARSISEAIKTEIFLFLTRAGDYSTADREERLDAEVQRLEKEAGDLQRYVQRVEPEFIPLPQVRDLPSYINDRVTSYAEAYYLKASRQMQRRLRAAKAIEVALTLLAAALAATAATWPNVGAWAAVATTAAGAVAAHAASEHYESLWIVYSSAANELDRLVTRRTAANGRPLSERELISECERVISAQTQAWMAKWGEENSATVQ
jgi:SMODS and SLOG-associating 2TM effector domain 1/Protein of unknown function (DUF4231)